MFIVYIVLNLQYAGLFGTVDKDLNLSIISVNLTELEPLLQIIQHRKLDSGSSVVVVATEELSLPNRGFEFLFPWRHVLDV